MKLLYFDLENTLIEHWTDQSFCWVESNKRFLDEISPDVIGIFSFALYSDERIKEFDDVMRERIESLYGIKIEMDEVINVDDMIASDFRYRKLERGTNDHKLYTFMDWCYSNQNRLQKFSEVWIVDDSIDDVEINEFPFKVFCRNPVVTKSFI